MNVKIERINKDIGKTKEKIAEYQARLRELERQKTELENTEIVDIVRGTDISLADLAALLKAGGLTPAASEIGVPAKSDDFVGGGGATERADFGGVAAEGAERSLQRRGPKSITTTEQEDSEE